MDDFLDEFFIKETPPLNIRAQLEGSFFFSCIWSLGATLDLPGRAKFDILFRALLEKEFDQKVLQDLNIELTVTKPEKPYIFSIPDGSTVFDYRYIKEVRYKRVIL